MGYIAQQIGQYKTYTPSYTGFSANPVVLVSRYCITGKMCHVYVSLSSGTSNANTFTITLPFAAANTNIFLAPCRITDNGAVAVGRFSSTANSNILDISPTIGGATNSWTTSGAKGCYLDFTYETV
jgi:hypothetical protein